MKTLEDLKMGIAAKIDAALREQGMKRQELAKRMDVRPSVITRWLKGTENMQIDTIFRIEQILGITIIILAPIHNSFVKYKYNFDSKVNDGLPQMCA